MKKKIMFIVKHLGDGGIERVVSLISKGLSCKGLDVSILCLYDEEIKVDIDEKVKVCIPQKTGVKIRYGFNKFRHIKEAVIQNDPDIIISLGNYVNLLTLLSCAKLDKKIIVSERGTPSDMALPFKILRKIYYKRPDGFIFQTKQAKSYFNEKIQNRSVVIENPIKCDLPQRHKSERRKVIVSIGRLKRVKNFPLLLDSYKLFSETIPGYKLVIYGDGPLRKKLDKLAAKLGIKDNVEYKGYTKNIHAEIVDCAMFVQSSDYEGISNAMLESLAIGLPTVVTDQKNGGPKRFIKNGENGFLVPLRDKEKMAEAMIKLASDTALSETFSKNSVSIKDELALENIISKWEDFLTGGENGTK